MVGAPVAPVAPPWPLSRHRNRPTRFPCRAAERLLAQHAAERRGDSVITIASQSYQLYDLPLWESAAFAVDQAAAAEMVEWASTFNTILAQMNAEYLFLQSWVALVKVALIVRVPLPSWPPFRFEC